MRSAGVSDDFPFVVHPRFNDAPRIALVELFDLLLELLFRGDEFGDPHDVVARPNVPWFDEHRYQVTRRLSTGHHIER